MSKVVVFDLEATCQKDDRSFPKEIIEIGAVDLDGNEFSQFIKPIQRPLLTDFCKELTTITQEDVDNARLFKYVYPEFLEFIKDATILSWGNYDKNQLIKDLKLNRIYLGRQDIISNHVNLKDVYQEKTGFQPKGMKNALNRLNIPMTGTHHRGIDDARNLMNIYKKIKSI